ncbi:MAG TPA: DMT family transporter [Methylomirabilota bacterium]|nr:DMT family transporter [Methylomirabilota bacterium]
MIANVALLVGISLAWAAGYIFIRDADSALPPITSTAVMAAVASVVVLTAVLLLRRPIAQPLRRAWVPLVMVFSAVALPFLATTEAERSIDASLAAVLGTTVPIATLLLTTFVTRQTPFSPVKLLGIVIAVAGLVVFAGWRNLVSDDLEVMGILVMIAGSVVFAVNGIFVSYQARDLDPYALALWTMVFAAVVLTGIALAVEGVPPVPATAVVRSLVGEGAIGMGLAYLGYYALVARAGATFGSLYAFLVPPFGVIAAALVFGQPLTLAHFAGLAIVLVGLALMMQRDEEAKPSPPAAL